MLTHSRKLEKKMATASVAYDPGPEDLALEDRTCRSCLRTSTMIIDWAQGDRVCTNCGVVDEEHLLDSRAEWREFDDVDDMAKGAPSRARSGMLVNDETRYWGGGLQPTSLSKRVLPGGHGTGESLRRRLLAAHKKIQQRMERLQSSQIRHAKIDLAVHKRKRNRRCDEDDNDEFDHGSDVRPEFEAFVMQEEEDTRKMQAALYAEKWSLKRALLLFGAQGGAEVGDEGEESRDELEGRLDRTLVQASKDLYMAYSMLIAAASRLDLSNRIMHEASNVLCQYAQRRDGLPVRGVSTSSSPTCNRAAPSHKRPRNSKVQLQQRREYNKAKQMGSLCAALLFLTARNLGHPRSLVQVCASVLLPDLITPLSKEDDTAFIQRRHFSKAMAELREHFPNIARSVQISSAMNSGDSIESNNTLRIDIPSIQNWMERTIRKLQLPPAAEAAIQYLVVMQCKNLGKESITTDAKWQTVGAAVTYFICNAGSILQGLAQQVCKRSNRLETSMSSSLADAKDRTSCLLEWNGLEDSLPPVEHVAERLASEFRAYEVGRLWDAWSEQMPWMRSTQEIEKAFGVSQAQFASYFRTELYPHRQQMLDSLRDAVLQDKGPNLRPEVSALKDAPLASVLLPQVSIAGQIMKVD